MKRGTGCSSGRSVSWLSDEKVSSPDRLRSTFPKSCETRCSPAVTASSSALGEVGDLRDRRGIFTIGSSSDAGDLGE